MYLGYARTGQYWWLGSPGHFNSGDVSGRVVNSSGSRDSNRVNYSYGVRPAIVLKPGVEIEGLGTYDEPYVVNTTS